ncbi:hypothetical protein D9M68_853120 [compost metagenome]
MMICALMADRPSAVLATRSSEKLGARAEAIRLAAFMQSIARISVRRITRSPRGTKSRRPSA